MKLMLMMPLFVGSQWRESGSSGMEEMPSQYQRSCVKYVAYNDRLFVEDEGGYGELAQKTCKGPMIPCAYKEDLGMGEMSDTVYCFPQEGSEKCCAIDADVTAGPGPKPKCGKMAVYNYSNPEDWGSQFKGPGMECGKSNGSPINIVTKDMKEVPVVREPLSIEGHKSGFYGTLCDNGYNLRLQIEKNPAGEIITFFHPNGLAQPYSLQHIEWHFGTKMGSDGSEHSVDGKYSDMEMQMVFFDRRNNDYGTALNKSGQVTVLSIMYEVGEPNKNLDTLVTELKSYKAGTEKTAMMGDLFTHKNIEPETASYHYYLGSMNHPPRCKQGIWWTVFLLKETISKEQLEVFQGLKGLGGNSLAGNNRPVQKNENTVNHHGPNLGTTTTTTTKPDGTTTTTQKPTPTPTPTTPNPTGTGDDGVTPTSPTGTQPEFDAGSDW